MPRRHLAILIFVLPIILGLGLNGCSPKLLQEPGRYFDKFRGFSVKFSSDWEVIKAVNGVKGIGPRDAASGYAFASIDIRVIETTDKYTLEEIYWQNLAGAQRMPDFKVFEEDQITIDNVDAKRVVYSVNLEPLQSEGITYTLKPEPLYTSIFYIFVKGHMVYTITCISPSSKFSEYKSSFEEVVQGFRFEEAAPHTPK